MASMAMTSSFLGGSAAAMITRQLPTATTNRHGPPASIRASSTTKVADMGKIALNNKKEEESVNGRRGLVSGSVAAVAVAAAFSFSKIAMADDDTTVEPKRGTPEAKKKYAPVCVTNPTARICRR